MRRTSSILVLVLLLVICFTLATLLQPRAATWSRSAQTGSVLKVLLGDGRRLFARHFFEQADISFHSGYYPSIFDAREKPKVGPMVRDNAEHDEAKHEREMAMGQPHDGIEAFGRHFRVTEHTHLAHGQEREILPWLRLSAELDPQLVENYTVASYWLCKRLGKVKEAEEFLRDGLRNNPNNCEILYELGRLNAEEKHDVVRARNLWDLALSRWAGQQAGKKEPNFFLLEQITAHLASIEEQAGNYQRAIDLYELAKKSSPNPIGVQIHINDLRQKMSATTKTN